MTEKNLQTVGSINTNLNRMNNNLNCARLLTGGAIIVIGTIGIVAYLLARKK